MNFGISQAFGFTDYIDMLVHRSLESSQGYFN